MLLVLVDPDLYGRLVDEAVGADAVAGPVAVVEANAVEGGTGNL